MQIIEFIFQSFWTWLGSVIFIAIVGDTIVKLFHKRDKS